MYCVAPISTGDAKLPNYDFWVVGVNCCSKPHEFNCGDAGNFRANSGLRSLNNENHPFYRLAVQQAEAAYDITATHPVFFYWTQDPLDDIEKLLQKGIKFYLMGVFSYL